MSENTNKIMSPTSGSYITIKWALRNGIVNEQGQYLDGEGNVVALADVIDPSDVDVTEIDLEAVEAETTERVLAVTLNHEPDTAEQNASDSTNDRTEDEIRTEELQTLVETTSNDAPQLTELTEEQKEALEIIQELEAKGIQIDLSEGLDLGMLRTKLKEVEADMASRPKQELPMGFEVSSEPGDIGEAREYGWTTKIDALGGVRLVKK